MRFQYMGARVRVQREGESDLDRVPGRSTLLRNARTHRARLKTTTPCRPDVSKAGGAVIFRVNPSREEFSFQDYTTPIEFIERTWCFPRTG